MYSIHTRIWIYVYLYTCTHTLTCNFIYIKNVYAKTWIKPFSTSSDWHLYKKSIWSFLLSMTICSQIFPIHMEVTNICKYLKGIGKPIHTHTHTHTHEHARAHAMLSRFSSEWWGFCSKCACWCLKHLNAHAAGQIWELLQQTGKDCKRLL